MENLFARFEHYFNSSRILFRTCQEKHPITADLCLKINNYFLFDFFVGILLANRSYYNNLKTFVKKLGEDPSIIRAIHSHLTANLSFVLKYPQQIFRFAVSIFQQLSFGNFPTITSTNNSLSSSNLTHLQIGLQLAVMLVDLLFSHTDQMKTLPDFHEQIISALVRMAILFQNRYLQRLQILKLLKRFAYRYPTKMLACESYLKNLFEYIDIFRVRSICCSTSKANRSPSERSSSIGFGDSRLALQHRSLQRFEHVRHQISHSTSQREITRCVRCD